MIEFQSGQVKAVVITGDSATIDKIDGARETVTIGSNDGGAFEKIILDYNATQPADKRIALSIERDSHTVGLVGSVLLSLLPLFLLFLFAALFFYIGRTSGRRS